MGMRVLMVDRRRAVGLPVQCAEYVPRMLVGTLGLGTGFVVQSVRGLRTHVDGQPVRETAAPGFIIRRDALDRALVEEATAAGAHLMLSTRAVKRIDNNTVLLKRGDGHEFLVEAQVIVGADGPRSTVGRWVGSINSNLLLGLQVTVPLAVPHELEYAEVYFDRDIYGGYGWLFPRGDTANVGLGCKPLPRGQETPNGLLRRFVAGFAAQGKVKNDPIRRTGGLIPAESLRKAVHGNVLLAGDAAGHTHPITGAGIFPAITCGEMAGKWAAQSIIDGNTKVLENYDEEWMDLLAGSLAHAHKRRLEMDAGWPDFPHIIPRCWIAFPEYHDRRNHSLAKHSTRLG